MTRLITKIPNNNQNLCTELVTFHTKIKKKMAFEKLFCLYEKFGSEDYIGEPVTQTEHMIQAAMFAENDGCSPDVVLACFFHDIGHLLAFESELEQMAGFGLFSFCLVINRKF